MDNPWGQVLGRVLRLDNQSTDHDRKKKNDKLDFQETENFHLAKDAV